jgi:hypothetical protein
MIIFILINYIQYNKISIKKNQKSVDEHYEKLSLINDSSKLFLYSKLKSDIKLEEYLKSDRNFKNRQLLTKFRLSDHIAS